VKAAPTRLSLLNLKEKEKKRGQYAVEDLEKGFLMSVLI
jgi:hypothetical protein